MKRGVRGRNGVLYAAIFCLTLLFVLPFSDAAAASKVTLRVKVDLSEQKMRVYKNGKLAHAWKVSTGRKGHHTPVGVYTPKLMKKMHYSKKYGNAPMPYSIFFLGGYAIHGTNETRRLGKKASHGCIRLSPKNASKLYRLVQATGKNKTRIIINN